MLHEFPLFSVNPPTVWYLPFLCYWYTWAFWFVEILADERKGVGPTTKSFVLTRGMLAGVVDTEFHMRVGRLCVAHIVRARRANPQASDLKECASPRILSPRVSSMDQSSSNYSAITHAAVSVLPKHDAVQHRPGEGETESTIDMLKRHHSMAPENQHVPHSLSKDEQGKSSAVCGPPSRWNTSGQWTALLASINSFVFSSHRRRRQQSIPDSRMYRGRQEIRRRCGNSDYFWW